MFTNEAFGRSVCLYVGHVLFDDVRYSLVENLTNFEREQTIMNELKRVLVDISDCDAFMYVLPVINKIHHRVRLCGAHN